MRPLLALLALMFVLPTATAMAVPSPVEVKPSLDVTLPGDGGCGNCVGAEAGASVSMTNCFDCPAVGVAAGATTEGGKDTVVFARACYSAYVGFCIIDETLDI